MDTFISGNKKIAKLGIVLGVLLSTYTTHANNLIDYTKASNQAYYPKDDWRLYPLTIQLNGNFIGLSMPLTLLQLPSETPRPAKLAFWGGSMDFSILYVKRSLWKYLDCYPRLGIVCDYHRLSNQGNIWSSSIYLEPNYNHTPGWELLPRLGIGIAYTRVPGHHPDTPPEEEDASEIGDFMQGPSLDLGLGIGMRYRLTPKWHIYAGLGVHYLLAFYREEEEDGKLLSRTSLTLYNFNIGGSYTFNPNPQAYTRQEAPRKSRIDISTFHSFKKANTPKPGPSQHGNSSPSKEGDNLHYVGGLYAQGSLQLANNHAVTLASEWIKNQAAKKETKNKIRSSDLQVGALLGHEFWWGKLTFGQAVGCYLLNDTIKPPFGSLYTRLTLTYYFTDALFIGTSLKTAILPDKEDKDKYVEFDYVDFRLGYSFSKKY